MTIRIIMFTAVTVLAVTACGSSAQQHAGQPSTPAAQPTGTAPTRTSSIPANAMRIKTFGHTTIAAWCIVQKSTDENGNPLDAAEVEVDNRGTQFSAQVITVGIDLFTAGGKHMHLSGTDSEEDDYALLQTGASVEVPPGQITSIGGLSTVVNGGSAAAEIPPQVHSCTVVHLG